MCSHAGDGGAPDVRGSGRKRKGMEAAEEASSETTGRDAVHGVGAQQGIRAVASGGGSGKDSAFFQVRGSCLSHCTALCLTLVLVG